MTPPQAPAWDGYLADPFIIATGGGFVAYGSGPPFTDAGAAFRALTSPDLMAWSPAGDVFMLDHRLGTDCWAPEVLQRDGVWWMYYSAGRGIDGHHLRVAQADDPLGPFRDVGVDLTPEERFAIDAHPFVDEDGRTYLFFARDVLEAERPGTHLAVAEMVGPTRLGETQPVLEPWADWQIYERDRRMYGRTFDWHTLEGPSVIRRQGTYLLTFSAGSWEGEGYAVAYATSPSPFGPWRVGEPARLLDSASTRLIGPGHSSLLPVADGMLMPFHAWNDSRTERQLHLGRLEWDGRRPPTVRLDVPVQTGTG